MAKDKTQYHAPEQIDLPEALARFQQVTDAITEIFYLADVDKRKVLFISPAYEKIFGRSCASILADPMAFFELVHPDDRSMVLSKMPQPPFDPYEFHYRIVRDDGAIRHIFGRGLPVLNERGECHRVVGLASDITAQVEAAHLIAEQQNRVVAAAKMSALGEMARGMAQEIDTPLVVIDGGIRHLQYMLSEDRWDKQEATERLLFMQTMTRRSLRVVRGLMEFSRPMHDEALVTTNLAQVVEDTVALCSENFKKRGVTLHVETTAAKSLYIDCSAPDIAKIIMCLLSNALGAVPTLPQKWVRLEILASGSKVELRVTDSGQGIPAGIQRRMMQPLFSTKRADLATGMGLNVAKTLTEAQGGRLEYDPECGNTRFVVTLLRAAQPQADQQAPKAG